jgi:hypothetical protein
LRKEREGTYEGVILAALEISRQRAALLKEIKAALLGGNKDEAIRLMYEFFGLYELDNETEKREGE